MVQADETDQRATLTLPDGKRITLPYLTDASGAGFVDVRTLFNEHKICTFDPGASPLCQFVTWFHCSSRQARPLAAALRSCMHVTSATSRALHNQLHWTAVISFAGFNSTASCQSKICWISGNFGAKMHLVDHGAARFPFVFWLES